LTPTNNLRTPTICAKHSKKKAPKSKNHSEKTLPKTGTPCVHSEEKVQFESSIETTTTVSSYEPSQTPNQSHIDDVHNKYYPQKNTAQPRLKDLTLEQLRKLKPETKETPPAGRFCGRCHFPLTSKHSVNFDSSFHLIDLKEKK
jgi:hypothetical protein